MSDPAVEAAARAFAQVEDDDLAYASERDTSIAAAREALAPIRALHRKVPLYLTCDYDGHLDRDVCESGFESADGEWLCPECTGDDVEYACAECRDEDGDNQDWPCATAKRAYPSEEL